MQVLAHLDTRSSPPFHGRDGRHILCLELSETGDGNAAFEGIVHNLSSGGMLLETSAPFTVGDSFVLKAPYGDQVEATIVWNDGCFFGCKFEHRLSAAGISAARLMSAFDKPPPAIAGKATSDTQETNVPAFVAGQHRTGGLTLRGRALAIAVLSIVAWGPFGLAGYALLG